MPSERRRAGIYVRISADPTGARSGVTRQRHECEQLAKRLGWEVAHIYEDNDVSASKGKRRPQYEALLEALQRGEVDAVIAWHQDRLQRHPTELERFIDTVTAVGAEVQTVSSGPVDLTTSDGRMVARIVGAMARAEGERKAERQRAKYRQMASQGLTLGGRDRLFGYTRDNPPKIIENEAGFIRDCAAMALNGRTLWSIARYLNDCGVTTTRGGRFKSARVKDILINKRLTGQTTYEGQTFDGVWEPIITVEQHEQLVAVLTAPQRLTNGGSTARKTLMPRFLYCGTCGGPLYSSTSSKYKAYQCRKLSSSKLQRCGGTSIRRDPVDAAVRERVIFFLSTQDPNVAPSSKLAEATRKIAATEEQLRRLDVDYYADDKFTESRFQLIRSELLKRLEEANREASEATFGAALKGLPRDMDGIAKAWDEGDLHFRRSLIETTIEKVIVHKPKKAGSVNVNPADRLEIIPRQRHYGERGIAPRADE